MSDKPTYEQLESEVAALRANNDRRRNEDRFWNRLRDDLITPLSPADIIKMCECEEKITFALKQKP